MKITLEVSTSDVVVMLTIYYMLLNLIIFLSK
ncbi:putative membrane protein [Propionispora sp. 2/2-37]|nr:putative membrane protein [Propionispora sp. 2/2-37]